MAQKPKDAPDPLTFPPGHPLAGGASGFVIEEGLAPTMLAAPARQKQRRNVLDDPYDAAITAASNSLEPETVWPHLERVAFDAAHPFTGEARWRKKKDPKHRELAYLDGDELRWHTYPAMCKRLERRRKALGR